MRIDRSAIQYVTRDGLQESWNRDGYFEPRERSSETVVHPETEAEMALLFPTRIERLGFVVSVRVSIGGANEQNSK
jgi:hypothetical protein